MVRDRRRRIDSRALAVVRVLSAWLAVKNLSVGIFILFYYVRFTCTLEPATLLIHRLLGMAIFFHSSVNPVKLLLSMFP